MHRFFVEPSQIKDHIVRITGGDVNHIRNVLRLQPGEEISVMTGEDDKEYRCGIEQISDNEVLCSLRFIKEADTELPCRVSLFQCLPKGDKMEFVIQKAVELGACEIVPVAAARSVVKLTGERAAAKVTRWQAQAEAAAKQSRRTYIPSVHPVVDWKGALALAESIDVKLLPYELAADMPHTRDVLSAIQKDQSVAVFIGPEGGFTEEEVASAKQSGFETITLGRRILRTETAGMTVLSWLLYLLEQ